MVTILSVSLEEGTVSVMASISVTLEGSGGGVGGFLVGEGVMGKDAGAGFGRTRRK